MYFQIVLDPQSSIQMGQTSTPIRGSFWSRRNNHAASQPPQQHPQQSMNFSYIRPWTWTS